MFSLLSIQFFSALKFLLAKMASESSKPTSQNWISVLVCDYSETSI